MLSKLLKKRNQGRAEMSFMDHLEELRWHIIRSLIAIILIGVVLFLNKSFVFDTLLLGPKNPDFWTYKMFCYLGNKLHINGLCIQDINFTIINTDLSGAFMTHLQLSFTLGLIFSFPYILWELWRFLKPALYERERRYASGLVLAGSLLFFIGVLFGYYIITPFSVNFLGSYQVSESVKNTITLESYMEAVTGLVLICGLVFEFPMVIYFLAKMGIITSSLMRKYRKYALVIILFLAAIITPSPDMFSQLIVAIPLYALFEISILVAKRVQPDLTPNI